MLWKGLQIAKTWGINEIIVLGDSRVIIQALAENTLPSQMQLHQLIRKIQDLVFFSRNRVFPHSKEAQHESRPSYKHWLYSWLHNFNVEWGQLFLATPIGPWPCARDLGH